MKKLSDEFLYQLRSANPIDSVMSSYVSIIRRGHNYICSCPFHSEKTPSCTIYLDTQSFYCFGCGSGGDVINFIRRIENLEYMESVRFLAERAGIDIPNVNNNDNDISKLKSTIFAINRETANFYYRNLISGNNKNGLKYIMQRELTPQIVKKYGVGFAPDSWDTLRNYLRSKGFSDEDMLTAKVCVMSKNGNIIDMFRNRVMFPIIDLRKNIVAFGGRVLDESKPKYLNTSDTPVFKKSRNLFSLNFAKNSDTNRLILAEGYMDVIAMNQAGFENVIATLGTSITPEHARLISHYTKEIIIAYDSDGAGQTATHKAINLLSEVGVSARIIKMEGAKDPDEYIKKFGADRFRMLINNAGGAINFELEKCKIGLDINSDMGKVEYLKRCVRVLTEIADKLERDVYISKVSNENGINISILNERINDEIKKKYNVQNKKTWNDIKMRSFLRDELNPEAVKYPKECKAEETIIAYLMKNPDSLEFIETSLSEENFVTSLNKKFFNILCQKLKENTDFMLSLLADTLNTDEMARITGIDARNKDIIMSEQILKDCICVLTSFNPERISFDNFSDDDLLNMQKKLKDIKG